MTNVEAIDGESFTTRALAAVCTLVFTLLFFVFSALFTLLALAAWPLGTRAVGAVARGWALMHRILSRFVLRQRVVVEGTLPTDVCFIAMKHEAMFETVDVLCLLNRPVVAAKKELLSIPIWGWVAMRYGVIPVDRSGGASALRAVRAQAKAAMSGGRAFVFYPEGTRVHPGEAPPLKSGFAGLYGALDTRVVPIAIDSGRCNPRGRHLRFPGKITYWIGEAIPPGLPRREAEARVHAAINALNE